MVEIQYYNSLNNTPSCFALCFTLCEYISEKYLNMEDKIELRYYIDLFEKNGIFKNKKSNIKEIIWSVHYYCTYDNIKFTMVYDTDYDDISFAVEELAYREELANKLCLLIEENRAKSHT